MVLDPNRYGHPSKLRGPVSITYGAGPDEASDGWYKFTETCTREITHPQRQTRQRACSVVYPSHPIGTVNEQRDGTGYYNQTTSANPLANGPTLTRIAWNNWYETDNTCYSQIVTYTREDRTIQVSLTCKHCNQAQYRMRIVTTNHYLSGGAHAVTTYVPHWTNTGGHTNFRSTCKKCVRNSEGDADCHQKGIVISTGQGSGRVIGGSNSGNKERSEQPGSTDTTGDGITDTPGHRHGYGHSSDRVGSKANQGTTFGGDDKDN